MKQDAEADIRLMRRISRDMKERGRTVDDVLDQYRETVRPMHQAWVEPSKTRADLIVHSTAHSMDVAIKMLTDHLRIKARLRPPDPPTLETGCGKDDSGVRNVEDEEEVDVTDTVATTAVETATAESDK